MTPDPSGAARAPQELVSKVRAVLRELGEQQWWHLPDDLPVRAPYRVERHPSQKLAPGETTAVASGIPDSLTASLIAHAPEWLGALVQAVEDLREKLGRANEQNQYCHDNHSPGQQMVIESQTQQLHDIRLVVAQLRADGQHLEERIKTARKFVLSAVGNLAEQNWEMCETELGAVLAALTTSDLGRDAP